METQEAISNPILLVLFNWRFNGGVFDKVGGEKTWSKHSSTSGVWAWMSYGVYCTTTNYIIQGTFFIHDILVAQGVVSILSNLNVSSSFYFKFERRCWGYISPLELGLDLCQWAYSNQAWNFFKVDIYLHPRKNGIARSYLHCEISHT